MKRLILGVHCTDIEEPPHYRCGSCPPGSTGNGTSCHDLDEVKEKKLLFLT